MSFLLGLAFGLLVAFVTWLFDRGEIHVYQETVADLVEDLEDTRSREKEWQREYFRLDRLMSKKQHYDLDGEEWKNA